LVKLDFEAIENNELVFIVVPSDLMQQVNLQILKYFTNTKNAIFVYTTFTKPYTAITKILEKNNIKTDKMFFIDCVTPVAGNTEMHGTSKNLFCQPQSLTNISIAIVTALKSIPKDRFGVLILDSISTLMLYNDENSVIRFIQGLSVKIRAREAKSLIFSLDEETDKKTISEISQFCDVCLRIKE